MEITKYVAKLNERFKHGVSTEHSYRGDLQNLLESILDGIQVTNEPKRISCGAPDYILTRGKIPVGYIEAKDVGKNLNDKKYKGQFDRYLDSLPNLIITDYLDFIFYREGEEVASVKIAEIDGKSILPLKDNFKTFRALVGDFVAYQGQTIKSSSKLAKLMAGKAKLMADVLYKAIKEDIDKDDNTELRQQLRAFKSILIHDIKPIEFADIYSQTIAYGMFAARLHDQTLADFSRAEAAELIPKSNPFLRKLFHNIAGPDLDSRIDWVVDALADIFQATNVAELLKDFGKSTQRNDPFIHFYETFLAEYSPNLKRKRGVWYTPEPIVSFIVRAIDDVLKTEFNLKDGLADTSKTTVVEKVAVLKGKGKTRGTKLIERERILHKVQILDPASGTGTFLAEIVKLIHQKYANQQGIWDSYVENELLPRLNGFEILMASYAMSHLKLELLLNQTGYKTDSNKRFQIYLTNSLEEHHPDTGTLFASWLSNEAREANVIKRDSPVMVVMGNPPYRGHSSNKGDWINKLLMSYKQEPGGGKLKEKNPKWLNDDYVKFIRYGQFLVEKNGEGVLAYICSHGFLDNPTFRGMRWNLLNSFDKIYILDLHGNTKKKEICPDGSPDKNVFDIRQGVSINIFIKADNKENTKLAEVKHFDIYGDRESKYSFLWKNNIGDIEFKNLSIKGPQYFFVEKDHELQQEYDKGFTLNEAFPLNYVGLITGRDKLVIDESSEDLSSRIKDFYDDPQKIMDKLSVKENKTFCADTILSETKYDNDYVQKLTYRPFDNRYIYYKKEFIERNRTKLTRNFIKNNIALVVGRQGQTVGSMQWNLVFLINMMADFNIFYRGGGDVFPLYILKEDILNSSVPNINAEITDKINIITANTITPENLLDYCYSVLHSIRYRDLYSDFLKNDFPRIPFPKNNSEFEALVACGKELRNLHLMYSSTVERFITTYPISGSNIVTRSINKKDYELTNNERNSGRVWVNDEQYFEDVPKIAWEFYIGGYQPAQKWLKDRKGRTLDHNDIFHYQKIIVALTETNRVMKEIDKVLVL